MTRAAPKKGPPLAEIELGEAATLVVDRMTDELGLWIDRGSAALFLASLAVACNEEPVPEDELGGQRSRISLDEGALDGDVHLALFAIVGDGENPSTKVLDEHLTGWIEAGAGILGPRIEGAGAVEATRQVRKLLDSIANHQ